MRFGLIGQSLLITLAMVVAACSTKPIPSPAPVTEPSVPTQAPDAKPAELASEPSNIGTNKPGAVEPDVSSKNKDPEPLVTNDTLSSARNSADYRKDAAHHIYRRLPDKIYKGKLPPMLKAVVVVDIHIEPSGQVGRIDWVRVPKHTPEVKLDIEQAIRQSAPFPAPKYLKQVSFTETWLWHRSGRFQLDTLTEGQL